MAQFDWKDLVDKTFRAKKDVKLYRLPNDSSKPYAIIKAGTSIGVLYSYINPSANTKYSWLMFYDANQKPYYVPVIKGTINVASLQEQGVKTTKEKVEEEKDKIEREEKGAVAYYIEKYVPWIIGTFILVSIVPKIIDKKI